MSPKKRPSWRERPEYENPEAQWRETDDIGYAVLAIGRWYASFSWPEGDVPEWALEACADLYDRASVRIEPVLKGTQGGRPHRGDYQLINRVARMKNADPSLETGSLFKFILRDEQGLEGEQFEHSLKRLMRYWGSEEKDPDGLSCNAHVNRVAKIDALARGAGRTWADFAEDGSSSPKRRRPRRRSTGDKAGTI